MEISISSPSLRSSASTTTAGRRTARLLPHLETCIKDIPELLYIHTSLEATVPDSYHEVLSTPFHIGTTLTRAAEAGITDSGQNGARPRTLQKPSISTPAETDPCFVG